MAGTHLEKIAECSLFRFQAPENNHFLIKCARIIYPFYLRLKYGGFEVSTISGLDSVKRLSSNRVIICPNHPSHIDADVAFLVSRLLQEEVLFLTAREVFLKSQINQIVLPLAGCFSVVRGSNDFESFKQSVDNLVAGNSKMIIFPEGEISGRNEVLLPLKPGPAHLACTALDHLRKRRINDSIHIVPVALKYSYPGNHSQLLLSTMKHVERQLGISDSIDTPISNRMEHAVEKIFDELLSKYDCPNEANTSFSERMQTARLRILEHLAEYVGLQRQDMEQEVELAHRVYLHLYESRWYEKQLESRLDFDRHHERYRLLNEYIHDLHRVINFIAVEKRPQPIKQDAVIDYMRLLAAEVLDKPLRIPVRLAISFGEPIDLSHEYDGKIAHKAQSILSITSKIETALSSLLGLETFTDSAKREETTSSGNVQNSENKQFASG